MRRSGFLAALAALAAGAAVLGGCETKADSLGSSGDRPIEQRADGRLKADPKPLTLADVRRQPAKSPQRTVFDLLFWGQWGSAVNIIDDYHPAVTRILGTSRIAGSFAAIRPQLVTLRPRVVGADRGNRGRQTVLLELQSRTQRPSRHSFTLRNEDGRWLIVHDTLLESALPRYVETATARDPNAPRPDAAAGRAGAAAARTYRNAFSVILQAENRERSAAAAGRQGVGNGL